MSEAAVKRSRESDPVSAAQIRFLVQLRARAKSQMDVDSVKTVGEFVRAKTFLEGLIRARRKK